MNMFSCLTQKFASWLVFFLICRNVQVFDRLLFPKDSTYFNGIPKHEKIFILKKTHNYILKKTHNYNTLPLSEPKNKNSSAFHLQNVLESVWEEIVGNLALIKTPQNVSQNFIPMKLKVLLEQNYGEGLLFNKIHYLYVLFFMVDKMGNVPFLVMDI